MDLLSGLDFNVSQPPLQPQAKPQPLPAPVPVSTPQKQLQEPAPAKVIPQQPSVIEAPTSVSASPAPVLPAPSPVPATSIVETPVLGSPAKMSQQSKEGNKDPYAEPEALNQFVQDVERLEKVVEGLTNKTLNGPTPLDLKWKELQELQEKDVHKRSISVARCYPMKNRFPDILPYDHSRVELPSTKDDYINASHIKNLTPLSPDYIMTQAPLPSTYVDFWTMIWEQQTELVVCLLSDTELQGHVYWPAQKGEELSVGKIRLSLQTVNVKSHWTERLITLVQAETRIKRVIVHLQFTTWPGSSFPASPSGFLSFVSEGLSQHAQQRSSRRPVVVHCLSGVGRSGLFCLVSSVMVAIRAGQGLLEIIAVAAAMGQQRRGALRDRQHLLFAYQAVLYHCQDLLMKRGILTSRSTFDDALAPRTHARHPSEDFLLGPGSLSQLQSGIEKMGLGSANIDWTVPPPVKPPSPTKAPTPTPAPETVSSLSDLAAFAPDPASLSAASGKHKARSSKEEFEARRGSISGSLRSLSPHDDSATNDPLSQLDPLWSLKHQ
ncbi:hypothetical protein B566_EDAN005260 [Ephemera danica]|nr:hypothetical protein B566_EDAN005260 [Ephemera danica]